MSLAAVAYAVVAAVVLIAAVTGVVEFVAAVAVFAAAVVEFAAVAAGVGLVAGQRYCYSKLLSALHDHPDWLLESEQVLDLDPDFDLKTLDSLFVLVEEDLQLRLHDFHCCLQAVAGGMTDYYPYPSGD